MPALRFVSLLVLSLGILLAGAGCQTGPRLAQTYRVQVPAAGVTLPLQINQHYLYVYVRVNGAGPFLFNIDTGSQLDLIRTELLPQAGIQKIEGVNLRLNETAGHFLCRGARFSIGEVLYEPELVGATDFLERVSQMAGMRVDGVIGAGLLAHLDTVIDYENAQLTLRPSGANAPLANAVPAKLQRNLWHLEIPFDLGDGQRDSAPFLLDTGYRGTLALDARYLASAGINLDTNKLGHRASVTVSGLNHGFFGHGGALQLGSIGILDVPYDVAHLSKAGINTNQAGMLGAEILRRFTIRTDSRASSVSFEPNSQFRDAFWSDAAGALFSARGANYDQVQIDWVRPGSPAEAAGLRADDWIRDVDQRPVSAWKLSDLRQRFSVLTNDIPLRTEQNGTPRATTVRAP